jgi:hypothetical protein
VIYKFTATTNDYDQVRGAVVVADSPEEAYTEFLESRLDQSMSEIDEMADLLPFDRYLVEEVDPGKPGVVLVYSYWG